LIIPSLVKIQVICKHFLGSGNAWILPSSLDHLAHLCSTQAQPARLHQVLWLLPVERRRSQPARAGTHLPETASAQGCLE